MKLSVLLINTPLQPCKYASTAEESYWEYHNRIRFSKHFSILTERARDHFDSNIDLNIGLLRISNNIKHPDVSVEYMNGFRNAGIKYDIVGISCYSSNYHIAKKYASKIKNDYPDTIVTLGGPHASNQFKEILEDEFCPFDFVIVSNGVHTFRDIVITLTQEDKSRLFSINGLSYKFKNEIIFNNDLGSTKNQHYYSMYEPNLIGDRYLPVSRVFFSNGCPFSCKFCANPRTTTSHYNIKSVISDILLFKEHYKTELFYISDENFIYQKKRAMEIANSMNDLGEDTFWACQSRAQGIDEDVVEIIAKGKCLEFDLGIESCNDSVLKKISKNLSYSEALKNIDLLQKYNLNLLCYFIIGLPGDNKKRIYHSFKEMARLIERDILVEIGLFVPYPGTYIFNNPTESGITITSYDYSKYRRGTKPVFEFDNGLKGEQLWDIFLEGIETHILPAYKKLYQKYKFVNFGPNNNVSFGLL